MKKIYINYWIICLMFVGLFSCSNDDDQTIFSETPSERIAERNSELQSLLLSQDQGYKGVYFSKNDEFGGFTFYMNFNADGTVQMTSDFNSETAIQSSSYEVRLGTTTELIFTTRNHIQKVSETSGIRLAGFRGTSVFQYFSNENGVITFRDIRNRDTATLILEPTSFTDFETESVVSVIKSLENRNDFVNSDSVTAFSFMTVNSGTSLTEYSLNYDGVNLFANPTTRAEDGTVSDLKFGIAFTEDGLIISPALEVNGVFLKNFTFDGASGFEYVAEEGGVTAKIGYSNIPVGPLDIYEFGVRHRAGVFNMDEMFKHSTAFNTFYQDFSNTIANDLTLPGLEITNVILWELNNDDVPFLDVRTNYGNVFYDIDFVFDEDTGIVTFSFTGVTNAPAFFTAIIQPLLDVFLGSPSGYYAINTGTYLNFPNITFGLISVDDPTLQIDYWAF